MVLVGKFPWGKHRETSFLECVVGMNVHYRIISIIEVAHYSRELLQNRLQQVNYFA